MNRPIALAAATTALALAALALGACFPQGPQLPPDEECNRFHDGKFAIPGQEDAGPVLVRVGETQTETAGEKKSEYRVQWVQPCVYELYKGETATLTARVVILGVQGDTFDYALERPPSRGRLKKIE